jgi:hypothetical protein
MIALTHGRIRMELVRKMAKTEFWILILQVPWNDFELGLLCAPI